MTPEQQQLNLKLDTDDLRLEESPDQKAFAEGITEEEYVPENSLTNKFALESIDEMERRIAQGFENLAGAMSSLLNQYSTQTQIAFELMRERHGVPLSEHAAKYKQLMLEEEEALKAQYEAEAALAAEAAQYDDENGVDDGQNTAEI